MTGAPVGDADYVAIQRFVHQEAALLDRRAYEEWLALLTEDIRYVVTARVVRPAEEAPERYAIVDEGADKLRLRVAQLADPRLTRAENPPSLTRRFVSNIVATEAAAPEDFAVETSLLVWRSRATAPGGFYVGERTDLLRRTDAGLRLARREVRLDQTVLYDGSMSTIL